MCASRCLHNSLPVSAHSLALTVHSSFSSFTSPLCLPPSSFSHCITPYIHEFPVYHDNLCMKIEGGMGKNKKTNRVNVDGGFVSSGCRAAQAAQSSGDICKKTLIPSPFSFLSVSFLFSLSFHPPTNRLPSFPPNMRPPLLSSPQSPTYPLPFSSRLSFTVSKPVTGRGALLLK